MMHYTIKSNPRSSITISSTGGLRFSTEDDSDYQFVYVIPPNSSGTLKSNSKNVKIGCAGKRASGKRRDDGGQSDVFFQGKGNVMVLWAYGFSIVWVSDEVEVKGSSMKVRAPVPHKAPSPYKAPDTVNAPVRAANPDPTPVSARTPMPSPAMNKAPSPYKAPAPVNVPARAPAPAPAPALAPARTPTSYDNEL